MVDAARIGRQIPAAMRQDEFQIGVVVEHAAKDQVMHRDRGVERVADDVDQIMVAEPARLGEPGRVHEDQQAELLDAGENLAETRGRQILAADIGRDLDAAETQGFVQPVEFGDGEIGGLERHSAERHEAVGVTSGDVGEVVVDDAGGSDAEIGVGAVIGLVRRGRDRLDVDPHPIHVGEPIFDQVNWMRLRSACWRLTSRVRSLA